MSTKATQIRVGMIIVWEGNLMRIDSVDHVTPGKGRAHVQTLLRNIRTGQSYDHRFRPADFVDRAVLEQADMEYLYKDGDQHVFMNSETFDQLHLNEDLLGDTLKYILPNNSVRVETHEGVPVGITLPMSVKLKVVETEPALKGATASGSGKPATLETGLVVTVPQFIEVGETVEVDTRSGAYLTRA